MGVTLGGIGAGVKEMNGANVQGLRDGSGSRGLVLLLAERHGRGGGATLRLTDPLTSLAVKQRGWGPQGAGVGAWEMGPNPGEGGWPSEAD